MSTYRLLAGLTALLWLSGCPTEELPPADDSGRVRTSDVFAIMGGYVTDM